MINDKNEQFLMMYGPHEIREKAIIDKEKYPNLPAAVLQSPLLTDDHAKLAMEHRIKPEIKENGWSRSLNINVKSAAPKEPMTSLYLDEAEKNSHHMFNPDWVIENRHQSGPMVTRALKASDKTDLWVVRQAVTRHHDSPEVIDHVIKSPQISLARKLDAFDIKHEVIKSLSDDHVGHLIDQFKENQNGMDNSHDLRKLLERKYKTNDDMGTIKVPEHLVDKIVDHPGASYTFNNAIKHSLKAKHVDKLLQHEDESIRYLAISHPLVTDEHLIKVTKDEDENDYVKSKARKVIRTRHGEHAREFFKKHGIKS